MVKTMFRRIYFSLVAVLALVCLSCDSVPLLAPTNSTVTIDAQSRVLPTGGQTEVTATVIESGGTPVHNGTLVRFTTSLGRVDPVEAQTRNGMAVTTFFAGNDSGVADVRATSGGAGSTTTTPPPSTGTPPPTTTTPTNSNVVQISIGSGAIDTITVRANPATVSTNGGTVSLIATVVGAGGRTLSAITVNFTATRGTLSSTSAVTDTSGEARVTLTTNGDTDITAAAGTKTATAKVTGQPGPSVILTCAVGQTSNCATVTANQTIIFTAARAQGSANLASATLDFGDNTSANLGTLSAATNVPHAYSQPGTYTARLTGTDANGETSTSNQVIQVSAAADISLTLSANAQVVTGTVVVNGGTATQYAWNFDGGTVPNYITTVPTQVHTYTGAATLRTVTVMVTLSDGRTITLSRTITV
jgi:hypothetical protein